MAEINDTRMADCISELPDEVLCLILSFSTVKDAFQAKLLSRRWRHLQVPLSNLYFNQNTMFGTEHSASYLKKNPQIKSEFVERVDGFLKLFRGPYLNSFMVCFCLDNEFASHIDYWVAFAVRMNAESIKLKFHSVRGFDGYQLYNFPFHLLPFGKGSRLKRLRLTACLLRPPPEPQLANWLSSLKTLDLQYIPLDQTGIDIVLSACLDLDWLILKFCRLPETARVCGRLKGLRVFYCERMRTIELRSVDLQAFEYSGLWIKVSFLGVPRLERVHFAFLNPWERGTNYIFTALAKDLPELQILSLHWFTAKARPIPAIVSTFSCLKKLDMFVSHYIGFDLLSINYILNACPRLQKFHLSLSHWGRLERQEEKVERYSKSNKLSILQLDEIEISGFQGSLEEMELAIYLLNNVVALKRMVLINSQKKMVNNSWMKVWNSWTELDRMQIHDSLCNEIINPGVELIVI